jgi:hypothetical protein
MVLDTVGIQSKGCFSKQKKVGRKSVVVVVDCNIVHVYQRMTLLFMFLHNLSKSQFKINTLKFLIRRGEKIP